MIIIHKLKKIVKMRILITVIFIILTLQVVAQGVTGKIVDGKQRPVPFANIAVLSSKDSTLTGGTASDGDGNFSIKEIYGGNLLKISSLGYKTRFMAYNGAASMTITLDEDAHLLSELVVKSQMPKTILEKEGMTTIVTGSILENTSSLVHLLEQIPYVSVQNDEITVLGRGTPLIFINGWQMRDRMELERLQPDEIKKWKS